MSIKLTSYSYSFSALRSESSQEAYVSGAFGVLNTNMTFIFLQVTWLD